MEKNDQDAHTTAYSAIPASVTTERIAEATDWESLEQIWEDLPKSTKAPEWKNFWKFLADWAHYNINQGTIPIPEWTRMQVAAWARKVLNFSEKSAKILIDEEISGAALLTIPSLDALIKLYGVPAGPAGLLWAEIEKMNKFLAEPDAIQQTLSVTREELFQAQLAQARPRGPSQVINYFITSAVGRCFPLVGRAELLELLRKEIRKDYEDHLKILKLPRQSYGDKTISFKFCYGAPGIGKTRFLYELMQNLIADNPLIPRITKWHTISIHFSNGLSILDDYDKSLPAANMLAIRILKSEVFEGKVLENYCAELREGAMHSHITLRFAIELISKVFDLDNECGIILTIDEINKCFEANLPSNYVQQMLIGLANVKSPDLPYVLPIFAGTSYVGFSAQVKGSGFKLKELPLGLLSNKDVFAMAENIQQQGLIPAFHDSAAFKQLLRDCGGLPRFVQFVCETAAEYYQTHLETPMGEWDWTHIQDQSVIAIDEAYHLIPSEALIDCLLGMRVDRKATVVIGRNETWGQLEMSGAIVIVDSVPIIPFLGLLNFVKTMPDQPLKQLSIWPMLNAPAGIEKCFTWQDWERFNMEFAVMKLKLLFARFPGPLALSNFFPDEMKCPALARGAISNISIVPCIPKFIESQHQIGPKFKGIDLANHGASFEFLVPGHCIKNGVGGAADGILVLQYITKPDDVPAPLVLLFSMKWTEATTLLKNESSLDLGTINEEVEKMTKQFNYIQAKKFCVICTGKPCEVEIEKLPADTIVIHKAAFASYFGPTFKSRAVFTSVSPRRDPNTMNPQELPSVGAIRAQKIIAHRKATPITSADELLQFIPKNYWDDVKKRLRFDDE